MSLESLGTSGEYNCDKIRQYFVKWKIVNFSYLVLDFKKSPNFITVYHLKKKEKLTMSVDFITWRQKDAERKQNAELPFVNK